LECAQKLLLFTDREGVLGTNTYMPGACTDTSPAGENYSILIPIGTDCIGEANGENGVPGVCSGF
jgi:hypothetical protein